MMTATKAPARVACEYEGCKYSAEPGSSIAGHVAMAHPDVPMDAVAPKRSARNDQQNVPAAPVDSPPAGAAILLELPLDLVDVGANVRVDVADLEELAASIAEHGVLQPIKATGPHSDGRYLVVWGQRRVLASRIAARTTIAALVVAPAADVDDTGATRSVEQLVENLHRADLNPIDRARAMRDVVDSGVSQADLARKLGIAPSTVANDLRLLGLDETVVERIRNGEITASHGKAIASLPAKQQRAIAERVARDKVSTKDLERDLEWKRAEADQDEAKGKRTTKALPKLAPALEAAAVPKDAEVSLAFSSYSFDVDAIVKAIKDAGWKKVAPYTYRQERPPQGKCDCTAVKVEAKGVAVRVQPVCADDRHRDRQRNAVHAEDKKEREALVAKAAEVRARIRPLLEEVALPVLVLAYADNWGVTELVANAGRAEYDVAKLRDELAARLAEKVDASRVYNLRQSGLAEALEGVLAMLAPAEGES